MRWLKMTQMIPMKRGTIQMLGRPVLAYCLCQPWIRLLVQTLRLMTLLLRWPRSVGYILHNMRRLARMSVKTFVYMLATKLSNHGVTDQRRVAAERAEQYLKDETTPTICPVIALPMALPM